jgi:hypothetical protein
MLKTALLASFLAVSPTLIPVAWGDEAPVLTAVRLTCGAIGDLEASVVPSFLTTTEQHNIQVASQVSSPLCADKEGTAADGLKVAQLALARQMLSSAVHYR